MAIKQSITSVSGAVTEYHRIAIATVDYTARKAYVKVLSYIGEVKRNEEKILASQDANREAMMKELDELVANPTSENEERRIELSEQINTLPIQTPVDVAPRSISEEQHEISLPDGVDFSLEFAYGWLKENIYKEAVDC